MAETKHGICVKENLSGTHNGVDLVSVRYMVNTTATAINNVENDATKAVKFVKNGQLYIQRGEKLYNVLGAMAE